MLRRTFGVLTLAALAACGGAKPLTETQRAAIADSVNAVVQGILADVNQRSSASFKDYSADPDARFVENGVLYPSLEALRSSDSAAKTLVTALNVRATKTNIVVLGPDAAVATISTAFTATGTNGREVSGDGVLTAVVAKRGAAWKVIASHESEKDLAKIMAAFLAPAAKKAGAKAPARKPAAKKSTRRH
ncbi:MAG TPA: nuclear transport factor 2 family protein [Gemmatimonadales bacterium]|nr:nuclear transport factor 2 family protein [Gemmatimonadales bacterium]